MYARNWIIAGVIAAWAAACGGSIAPIDSEHDGGGADGATDDGSIGPGDDGGSAEDGATTTDGAASDGGVTGDGSASDGGASAACPATAPQLGGTCPINNAVCEYGNDPKPECNSLAVCAVGRWQFAPRGACAPAGSTCPATYAAVPKGQTCTPEFLDCAYSEGQCNCARGNLRLDAIWLCTPTSAGCASPRPRLGSACTSTGLSCDYGACSGGVAETCRNGFWQRDFRPCPG